MANTRKVTVDQLQNFADGMTAANDARFTKKSDTGTLAAKNEVTKTELGSALKSEIEGKANASTTLSGYGITDAYSKDEIDGMVSSAYQAGGSKAAADLTSDLLVAGNEGKVYNLSDDLTITSATKALFVENAENSYPAGTNVVVINAGTSESPSYKFDVLAGFVDLSGYATTADVEVASDADIQAIVNGLYKESGN